MKDFFVLLTCRTIVVCRAASNGPEGFEHWTTADLWRLGQALNADAASDPHHVA